MRGALWGRFRRRLFDLNPKLFIYCYGTGDNTLIHNKCRYDAVWIERQVSRP